MEEIANVDAAVELPVAVPASEYCQQCFECVHPGRNGKESSRKTQDHYQEKKKNETDSGLRECISVAPVNECRAGNDVYD